MCLRCSTSIEMDLTAGPVLVNIAANSLGVGKWYEIEQLEFIAGCVHIVRTNPAEHSFTSDLNWPFHRFYVNRF